jgi:predicted TIM-barrel fold metal-dependent hydrolase
MLVPVNSENSMKRSQTLSRGHFILLVACVAGLAVPTFQGKSSGEINKPPADLHLYLLIGGADMAGRADIPEDAGEIIDRCYLLNEKNEWEPARNPLNRHSPAGGDAMLQKLGPGYSFARELLGRNKDISIGLIVHATDGVEIDDWLGKSETYWGARKRTKAAMSQGTLKGVLWHQEQAGGKAPDDYLDKLRSLVGNLRSDLNDGNLPFIAGQVHGGPEFNDPIARLPEAVHGTAFVRSEGLTTDGGKNFDTKSQLLLGQRYAEQMIRLQAAQSGSGPQPPSDIKFIDPHVHAMSVTPIGLRAVAQWMEDRNVERCIVSPLNHKGSRPGNEEEREAMLANFRPYKGRIDRMCIIDPGEVATADEAATLLKREIADGAVAFGEHYGVGLMFDDPKNLMLYEACEKTGLPVMFHIDQNKNMVEPGMARVDRVLKMFPKCKVVAHAYWWRQLQDGTCDRQLREHPNLYADMSGQVVVNVLNRDRKYAREFLIRHQDKILWATDEGWWSFGNRTRQMNQHYTFLEELDLPDEVRQKIYRGNAEKVYGLKREGQ